MLPEPYALLLLVGWDGVGWDGWDEWRDLGHFGLAEQGPHPTVAIAGDWMWQWGRFWQQDSSTVPAGWASSMGTLLLVLAADARSGCGNMASPAPP